MSIRTLLLSTATALTLVRPLPVQAQEKADSDKPCSAYAIWADSEERAAIANPVDNSITGKNLSAAYTGYLDFFYKTIDRRLDGYPKDTVEEVFGAIQAAYLLTSKEYSEAIESLEVTPQLLIGDSACISHSDCKEIFDLTNVDLEHPITNVSDVRRIISGTSTSNHFSISLQFKQASSQDYSSYPIMEYVKVGLTPDQAAKKLMPSDPRDSTDDRDVLIAALACHLK